MQFLPERGGATHPAFQCCFGNSVPRVANGSVGIMTCICVCELIKQWYLSGALLTGGDFFNQLT